MLFCLGVSLGVGAAASADVKELPRLDISWDCGDCFINPKVIPLIEKRYSELARRNGWTVSKKATAKASITDFRQRGAGLRIMMGRLGGKDRLALAVSYRKNEFMIEEYTAWSMRKGMDYLCGVVAEKLYNRIVEIR